MTKEMWRKAIAFAIAGAVIIIIVADAIGAGELSTHAMKTLTFAVAMHCLHETFG